VCVTVMSDLVLAAHGGGVGERGVRLLRGILPPPHGWASSRCGRWHATARQSQFVGLTRLQLDEIGRERQVQRQGA